MGWTTRSLTSAWARGDVPPDHSPASGRCLSTRSRWRSSAVPWSTPVLPISPRPSFTRCSWKILDDIMRPTEPHWVYISTHSGSKRLKIEEPSGSSWRHGQEAGRVDRLQLGGHSVDAEPHPAESDGEFPA